MVDIAKLESDARKHASKAVDLDSKGKSEDAVFFYVEAAQALISVREQLVSDRQQSKSSSSSSSIELNDIARLIHDYIKRAEEIKESLKSKPAPSLHLKNTSEKGVERARYLLTQALDQDEQKKYETAFKFYQEAITLCLNEKKTNDNIKIKEQLEKIAYQALERAEELKRTELNVSSHIRLPSPPRDEIIQNEEQQPMDIDQSNIDIIDKRVKLSSHELDVLRRGSKINGRDYVPFFNIDLKERFAYQTPFTDSHGPLKLAPKQQSHFARWARPDEIMSEPKMIMALSYFSIKQDLISDCSFVASLAVSVQYEKKFNKRLITSIIYPQNKQGEPVYNPCGKYMVRFHLNGVWRKVIIDDTLPIDRSNRLLCSSTTNKNEIWVSLLEKAYMKVMGGYDFPGSNSTVDLHALTGWIPELVSIHHDEPKFDKDKEFDRMFERFHAGHVLITVATPNIPKDEEDRSGLVSSHAYALLDMRQIGGHKLIMLKNPWSHLEWKGNFSDFDTRNWTPELVKALNYDPKLQVDVDNGVFWIDYNSLCHHFENFYLNWSPSLFSYTSCIHNSWPARQGPVKDLYNLGDNPQYVLRINPKARSSIWVLLTRHITERQDFAVNRVFITLFVYKNGGNKVYYPNEIKPIQDGVKTNSAHYLVKLVTDDADINGQTLYTLVVSQYEKNVDIYYSLRVYSTCEFSLTPVPDYYNPRYQQEITGEWKGKTAGGCPNNPSTYKNNPLYQLVLNNREGTNHVKIELRAPKQFQVGFEVICTETKISNAPGEFHKTESGAYRSGFCVLTLDNIPGGTYTIRPATFDPNRESAFFLHIASSHSCTLTKL
ncbi:unnamed protein product [Adineta steineri]|uniref:Calpain catalytic domain-containing protein n=2 Tax=Adineta steineri TaxID=433720 RepID=A0A818VJD5_9BILA|nr:unnamed protein product [Adineta steineri]CAF3708101.1 unnamed protein product [Adineta steineri]